MRNLPETRSSRCRSAAAVIAFCGLMLAMGGLGCKQDSTGPVTPDSNIAQGPDSSEAGQTCEDDRGCPGYLRCLDAECAEPPAVTGDAREDTPVVQLSDGAEVLASFQVELAVEPWERTRGLMFRKEMKEDWGMLFDFRSDGPRSFWMRNTLIPLDMLFINDAGEVVGIVRRAEPLSEEPRSVDAPSRYVLELKGGTAAKHGIEAGATMTLDNAPESVLPNPATD